MPVLASPDSPVAAKPVATTKKQAVAKPTRVARPIASTPAADQGAARRSKLGGVGVATAAMGSGAARTAYKATKAGVSQVAGVGAAAARGTTRSAGTLFGALQIPAKGAGPEVLAGFTVKLPFASATLRLPGPGAVATVGPVRVTLPPGALYYGGLTALVMGGTMELPLAAGAVVTGVVLGRRWLQCTVPEISIFDSAPDWEITRADRRSTGLTERN